MSAALQRRIALLEARVQSAAPHVSREPDWVTPAPEAALVYLAAVCEEATASGVSVNGEWLQEHRPAAADLIFALRNAALHEKRLTLRQCQHAILVGAESRLSLHLVRTTPGLCQGPDANECTMQRMLGIPYQRLGCPPDSVDAVGSDCWYDRSGETFVRQWWLIGTRDPETLALLGLGLPELALLDAEA